MKPRIAANVSALRPTQMTIPLARVGPKRSQLRAALDRRLQDFLTWHVIPAVLGPGQAVHLIGDHVVPRALMEERVDTCLVTIERDLSAVARGSFWLVMEREGWAHPYDELGRRRSYGNIPHSVLDLKDDPYRDLVADVCEYGGIAKDIDVAAEFAWATYLRLHIAPELVAQDYPEARRRALAQVRSHAARRIPGWRAP